MEPEMEEMMTEQEIIDEAERANRISEKQKAGVHMRRLISAIVLFIGAGVYLLACGILDGGNNREFSPWHPWFASFFLCVAVSIRLIVELALIMP